MGFGKAEEDSYTVDSALYLYARGGNNNTKEMVCIRHKRKQNGNFGLGAPVDIDTLRELLTTDNQSTMEILPEKVLINNSRVAVWWSARQKRRMFIRTNDHTIMLNVIYPSLIWGVNKHSRTLHISAIANKRPTMISKLFHAPLMNIDGNGLVCQGSATIPQVDNINQKVIESIETCIFDSNFTHTNHDQTLRGKETSTFDQIKYWKKKGDDNSIPRLNDLYQKGTVADFIGRI